MQKTLKPSPNSLASSPESLVPSPSPCAALSLSRLTLTTFRNHRDLRLCLDGGPVVLTGHNGSGKTNLLEAISLLVPGRGLCRAAPGEWQMRTASAPWAIVADIRSRGMQTNLATGRDPQDPESERRMVLVDGRSVRSQQALADHVAMAWVTPDMDRVLADGPSARRKLVDRMVYSFDPAHAGRVNRYEKALRERLRLLREGIADAAWLAGLEDEMAQSGVAIAAARLQMVRLLQTAIAQTESSFPHADLLLFGATEEALMAQTPALHVEDRLREALARLRGDDAQSGTCGAGPHRSDLRVTHRERACPADMCSTGEQKALLIAMMLAYVRMLYDARGFRPLFLLDDITAHLDSVRREALFDEIIHMGVQAWMTGTDAQTFAPLQGRAQFYSVEHGLVTEA